MSTPSVQITKADFKTGVVRPSDDGVLAILAPSTAGTAAQPAMYTQQKQAQNDFGRGKLVEDAAYDMAVAKKPVVLCKGTPTTAGTYGTIVTTGAGTSAITAGATAPEDDFDVLVTFVAGGTVGTAGVTYTVSLDGGKTTGPVLALGTANTIALLDPLGNATGVTIDLGAGTLLPGETVSFPTTGPQLTNADLTTPLESLRVAKLDWEVLLIDGIIADATVVSTCDLWLQSLEGLGKFRHIILNARYRDRTTPETEAAYRTAMQAAFSSVSSIRVCVGADGGDLVSLIRGITQTRPTALALAARAMSTGIEVDAAEVDLGALSGYRIVDDRGNPKYHDELLYPGLDDLNLVALRTFDGESGAYINNPRILSPSGSDYVFLQHARLMNRACEVAYQTLTKVLSKGVRKQRKPDPNTGKVYIVEQDAARIDGLVNTAIGTELDGKTSGFRFTLSRTDDLGSNQGATLTGELSCSAFAYVKKFSINAQFVRAIG